MTDWDAQWRSALDEVRAAGRWRMRRELESAQGVNIRVDGRDYLSFCSNDYLGLAHDERLVSAAQQAMAQAGFGAGASHLVIGHHHYHHELEIALARFVGRERALLFSSGYMANLAVLSTLADTSSLVLGDKLNHASLIDGAKLSGARAQRYLHGDPRSLQQKIDRFGKAATSTFVISDGVFSMDGDLAPLPELVAVCAQNNACLVIDDAHGLGVLGEQGAGTLSHFGLSQAQVPVLIGTLGKALGSFGAFVAGSDALIELLIQKARPYIYTTALPPATAAATLAALKIAKEEAWRREILRQRIALFRHEAQHLGLRLMDSQTPIQPLLIGSNDAAMRLTTHLQHAGILVVAIRPPTVPEGSARLRITLSAQHSEDDVGRLLHALSEAKEQGLLT